MITTLLSITFSPITLAADRTDVREKWHTPYDLYLSPTEAHTIKTANPDSVLLIDVRTRAEVKFIGMASAVDANIPIRFLDTDYNWSDKQNTYRTRPNENFAAEIEGLLKKRNLDKSAAVILMCQSGSRAPIAASALHKAGFDKVYTQHEGFEGLKSTLEKDMGARNVNGWKNAGLPWSYKLAPEKMYFNFSLSQE